MKRLSGGSDPRSEAGETLIEVLLASALMALMVVGIIGGVSTMVLGSSIHRDQAESNPNLVSAMERLKRTTRLCPAGTATLPAYSLPANVSISKIWYQKASGGTYIWSDVPNDCDDTPASGTPNTGTPDPDNPLTLQKITLKYTDPGATTVDAELQFVKGDN